MKGVCTRDYGKSHIDLNMLHTTMLEPVDSAVHFPSRLGVLFAKISKSAVTPFSQHFRNYPPLLC